MSCANCPGSHHLGQCFAGPSSDIPFRQCSDCCSFGTLVSEAPCPPPTAVLILLFRVAPFLILCNESAGVLNTVADALSRSNMSLLLSFPRVTQFQIPKPLLELLITGQPDWGSNSWTALFKPTLWMCLCRQLNAVICQLSTPTSASVVVSESPLPFLYPNQLFVICVIFDSQSAPSYASSN